MPKTKQPSAFESFNEIATVRIELEDTDPLIWREFEAPTSMTLKAFHQSIQAVMDWLDYHLWEFSDKACRYGPPMADDWGDTPRRDAAKVRLRDICIPKKTTLTYVYDFGDDWRMRVIVSNIRQGDPNTEYPLYVAGEHAAPPEDCGGLPGFYELLDALGDPAHPDHEEMHDIYDLYDPAGVNEAQIRINLSRINRRRNAARKRLAPKAT